MEKGIREVLDMAQQGENKKPLTLEDLTAGLLYYYGVIEWDALYRQLRDCFHIEIEKSLEVFTGAVSKQSVSPIPLSKQVVNI